MGQHICECFILFLFHLYELNLFLHFMWHCSPISLSKTFFIFLWWLLVIYLYAFEASKKFLLIVFKLLFCLYCSSILLYFFIFPIFAVTIYFNHSMMTLHPFLYYTLPVVILLFLHFLQCFQKCFEFPNHFLSFLFGLCVTFSSTNMFSF